MSLRRSARNLTATDSTATNVPATNGSKYIKPEQSSTLATRKRKGRASATVVSPIDDAKAIADPTFAIPDLPPSITPSKRRRGAARLGSESPAKPPPSTPTPSGVGLVAATSSKHDHPLEDLVSLKPRPAEPHITNAPLLTPKGSRVVAYSPSLIKDSLPIASQESRPGEGNSPSKKRKAKEVVPPDVGVLRPHTSTTDTLLKDAEEFLVRVDPRLKGLVEKHTCKIFSPEGLREAVDPFTALSSGIIGQQVSGQAAASIRRKFTALFPDTHPAFPSPSQILKHDIAHLRTAGLSQRKAEYITGLAQKFDSGELTSQMLISASDTELIEKLVAVRGLGRWSVEMFACFGLKRMDVFSTGDLGVQRGMAIYVGRDTSKLKAKGGKWKYMSEQEMLDIAGKFSPYRSLFMWYMWRISDVDVGVLQSE